MIKLLTTQVYSFSLKIISSHKFKIIGILYIITIVSFGSAYKYIADTSNGREFIFQEDILTQQRIDAFKRLYNLDNESDYLINYIILKYTTNTNKYLQKIQIGNEEDGMFFHTFQSNNNTCLGEEWAAFYLSYFKSKGYNYACINSVDEYFRLNKGLRISEIEGDKIDYYKHYKLNVSVFKCNIINEKEEGNSKEFRISDTSKRINKSDLYDEMNFDVIIDLSFDIHGYDYMNSTADISFIKDYYSDYNYDLRDENDESYMRIDSVDLLLSHSIIFINDMDNSLEDIMNGRVKYNFVDFLYFSTVTITTLGFGDIIPNSSRVRMFVMIESIIGCVLMGILISSIVPKKK